MTDPVEILNTMGIVLAIIGLLLAIIALNLLSIRRSLKTIAQNTASTSVDLRLPDDLHHTIGNFAWEAGRNFQAGMRTDR